MPHNININGVPQTPDFAAMDAAGFSIAATPTQVTVTNNNAAPASVNVWLELKHSIPRQLGQAPTGLSQPSLSPRPFVPAAGGGGGGDTTSLVGGIFYQVQFDLTSQLVKSDTSAYTRSLAVAVNSPGSYTVTVSELPPAGFGYVLVVNPRSLDGATGITTDVSAIGDDQFTVVFWDLAGANNIAPAYFVAQLLLFAAP